MCASPPEAELKVAAQSLRWYAKDMYDTQLSIATSLKRPNHSNGHSAWLQATALRPSCTQFLRGQDVLGVVD